MEKLAGRTQEIWKKIKKQPIDVWFFYLFLLTFALGVRKVILYFPIKGTFNEYAGAYVYASDIFLCLAILVWTISILYNKTLDLSTSSSAPSEFVHKIDHAESVDNLSIQNLSIDKFAYFKAFLTKMFHVEQSDGVLLKIIPYFRAILFGLIIISLFDHYLWDIWQGQVLLWLACGFLAGVSLVDASINCSTWNNFKQNIFVIPLVLISWSFVSLFWSENILVSFYRSTRFIELYVLFVYVAIRFVPCLIQSYVNCSTWNNIESNIEKNVPRGTICEAVMFFRVIIFLGVVQSLIGIAQFILQRSLGLFWLKESLVGQNILGVAKIIANHHVLIRSYGLFPHPNILGGFLFFSIMVTLLYKKMFHVEHFKGQNIQKCSTWNNFGSCGKRGMIWLSFIRLILAIQIIGIFLSFSKSAILALAVALVYTNVPRGTFVWNKASKMFHVEHFKKIVGVVFISVIISLLVRLDVGSFFLKSLAERNAYLSASWRIISQNPLVGVGTGQSILATEHIRPNWEAWQFQPVHNVFVLIWSEWGIVGLVLFILFLWNVFSLNVPPALPASVEQFGKNEK